MREDDASRARRARTALSSCEGVPFRAGLLAVVLLSGSAQSADEAVPADEARSVEAPAIELSDLPLLWQAQRAEIATAEVRFRCFNSSFENPQNTPEQVAELLARHDLVERPEELETFLAALTGRTFEERKPWDDMILTVSGRRRRVDGGFCRFVTDGDLEAVYTPMHRQLDLQPVGSSSVHHYDLEDLRWIPPQGVSAAGWQLLGTRDGNPVFSVPPRADGPAFEVITSLDAASGIVAHTITRYADGAPAMELYQRGLNLHASGVVFPRLRVDVTYANGSAFTVRVMLVQQAVFNDPVDGEAFVLPAPSGVRIVDHRVPDKDVWVVHEKIADALSVPVRATTPAGQGAAGSVRAARSDKWWWLFAGVHFAGATAAAAIFWHRRRSTLSRSTSRSH